MLAKDGSFVFNGLTAAEFTDITIVEFDPGTGEVESNDLANPVFDDKYMGVDFFRPPTWTFTLMVTTSVRGSGRARAVMDTVGRIARAWRSDPASKKAGALAKLSFTFAGSDTRTAYGRPRQFAYEASHSAPLGYATVTVAFELADPIIYGGKSETKTLMSAPPIQSGLKEMLSEPLTVGGESGIRQGVIEDTGGDAPAVFTVKVFGPGRDPSFSIDGNKYAFKGLTLDEGYALVVDSRQGTATYRGGNELSRMSPRSRLKGVRLPASAECEVTFGINDPTGLARCEFSWNPAYYSL